MTRARTTLAIAFGALAFTACGGGGKDKACDPTAPGCTDGGQKPTSNLAPVAEANGPYTGTVSSPIAFSSLGSRDPDGTTLTYVWSFGDNSSNGTEAAATHTYTAAGSYMARLTVKDDKGATATDSAGVTVRLPNTTNPDPSTGTIAVQLTDAPFPFDSVERVNVHVVRVDAQFAEVSEAVANSGLDGDVANTDPAQGWVTVAKPDIAINLLDLQNGRTTLLGQSIIRGGDYRSFRLVIDASRSALTLRGGANALVAWPAASRIGLKLSLPTGLAAFAVVPNTTTILVADFDIGKSFPLVGASPGAGGFRFTSTVRGSPAYNGYITGRLTYPNGDLAQGASIELLESGSAFDDAQPSHLVATTASDSKGEFLFRFLVPGTKYALRFTPPFSSASRTPSFTGTVTAQAGASASMAAVYVLDSPTLR